MRPPTVDFDSDFFATYDHGEGRCALERRGSRCDSEPLADGGCVFPPDRLPFPAVLPSQFATIFGEGVVNSVRLHLEVC